MSHALEPGVLGGIGPSPSGVCVSLKAAWWPLFSALGIEAAMPSRTNRPCFIRLTNPNFPLSRCGCHARGWAALPPQSCCRISDHLCSDHASPRQPAVESEAFLSSSVVETFESWRARCSRDHIHTRCVNERKGLDAHALDPIAPARSRHCIPRMRLQMPLRSCVPAFFSASALAIDVSSFSMRSPSTASLFPNGLAAPTPAR